MTSGTAAEVIRLWMIVDPGMLGQLAGGDQAGEGRGRHQRAPLVDDEAPVGVAVEGQADVGARGEDRAPAGRAGSSGSIGLASWLGKVPSSSK